MKPKCDSCGRIEESYIDGRLKLNWYPVSLTKVGELGLCGDCYKDLQTRGFNHISKLGGHDARSLFLLDRGSIYALASGKLKNLFNLKDKQRMVDFIKQHGKLCKEGISG